MTVLPKADSSGLRGYKRHRRMMVLKERDAGIKNGKKNWKISGLQDQIVGDWGRLLPQPQ